MSLEAIRDNLDEIERATSAIRQIAHLYSWVGKKYASQATSKERQALIVTAALNDGNSALNIIEQIEFRCQDPTFIRRSTWATNRIV